MPDNKYKLGPVGIYWLVLLFALCFAYFPALDTPFYLDDQESIQNNKLIHNESIEPLLNGPDRMRVIGYASFWLNYQIHQLDTFGYHIGNLLIHILNVVLVFIFAKLVIRQFSHNSENSAEHQISFWAFIIAALWALHPLNSQSVIYIVQRIASIASLFYLLTFISYVCARRSWLDTGFSRKFVCFTLLFIFSVVAGLHSKQNFVCVFLFIFCWEQMVAAERTKMRLWQLSAFGMMTVILIVPFIPEIVKAIDTFTRDYNAPERTAYFYTQMIVLWDYVARFLMPWGLQMEIGVKLRESFEPIVAFAMAAHVLLLTWAYRQRKTLPLVFLGVLFFYISHIVESSIIPIKDLAFEHRTYIGNIGLVLALVGLVKYWCEGKGAVKGQYVLSASAVLVLIYAGLVFVRAGQWQDPESFYLREVTLAPEHARANAAYGLELAKKGDLQQAEVYLEKSVNISLERRQAASSVLTAYMTVLYQQNKFQKAANAVMLGLQFIHRPLARSILLSNAAYGYIRMGFCDFAIGLLTQALELNPNNKDAQTNLNYCRQMQAKGR